MRDRTIHQGFRQWPGSAATRYDYRLQVIVTDRHVIDLLQATSRTTPRLLISTRRRHSRRYGVTNGPCPAVAPTSEEDGVQGRPFTDGRARGPVSGVPPAFQRDRMLGIRLIVAARAGPHACREMAGEPRELLPDPLNGGSRALGTAE